MGQNAELETFREQVVKVGLKAMQEHGFCEVVTDLLRDKLDLGDLLPPAYVLQTLPSSRHRKWQDVDEYDEQVNAVAQAEVSHANAVQERENFTYRNVTFTIFLQDSLEEHLDALKQAFNEVHALNNGYPRFRVVRREGKPITDTVVWNPPNV